MTPELPEDPLTPEVPEEPEEPETPEVPDVPDKAPVKPVTLPVKFIVDEETSNGRTFPKPSVTGSKDPVKPVAPMFKTPP